MDASSFLRLNNYQTPRQHLRSHDVTTHTHILQRLCPALALGSFRGFHLVANTNELPVRVLKTSPDRICNGLLNLLLHQARCERLQRFVQKVVLGVPDAELEGVDFDVDVFHLEHGRTVFTCTD